MKNTHCCQCGAERKPTEAVRDGFSIHDLLSIAKHRPTNSNPAPGVVNEQSPQLVAHLSVYRNGGSGTETHICDLCLAVGLRHLAAKLKACGLFDEKMFPIMGGEDIPWRLIQPFNRQALDNHSQSLERLAERGGLGPSEAIDILLMQRYDTCKLRRVDAVLALQKLIRERLAMEAA